MEDFLSQNVPWGLLVALMMQGLKKSDWFKLLNVPAGPSDKLQERVNRLVSVVAAFIVTLGIHYTWHYDGTNYELAFTGTVAGLRSGAWEVAKQWGAQHGMYKLVVVLPELLGNINTQLLQLNGKDKP